MSSTISGVTTSYSTSTNSTTKTSTANSELDFEDWINLLATELQNQDPTDPVSGTEYVSQMAQLSSLSQMENIYSSVNNVQAYSMIGKEVTYQVTDSSGNTSESTGTVNSVIISGSSTYLSINGTNVELGSVVQVADSSATA